ncbi:hypothetical protein, partial [Paenibacillus sp. GCM10023250]|uniref:hypothetical protein n=1 Tax=Paenibacillus sp. GCM10023250 TaxID=3252648 RepID=UPI0036162371
EDGSGRFKKTQDAAELALPILGLCAFYGLKLFPNLLLGQPLFDERYVHGTAPGRARSSIPPTRGWPHSAGACRRFML